mmetsp:Transcript_15284/g.32920  ORF Transcript_15284/g.32920 Transcript_15284/m.32920 type:complete len:162 (+) Transcript_15284:2046-2531(+)
MGPTTSCNATNQSHHQNRFKRNQTRATSAASPTARLVARKTDRSCSNDHVLMGSNPWIFLPILRNQMRCTQCKRVPQIYRNRNDATMEERHTETGLINDQVSDPIRSETTAWNSYDGIASESSPRASKKAKEATDGGNKSNQIKSSSCSISSAESQPSRAT